MKLEMQKVPEVQVGQGGASLAGWHQIQDFLDCPHRFQQKHVRGIRIPQVVQKDAFAVGSLVHAGRGAWLATQCDTRQEAINKVYAAIEVAVQEEPLAVRADAERQARFLVDEYINHWSGRPAPICHAVEYVLGPAPLQQGDPLWLMRTAKLDDFGRYPESGMKLALGELKTTSSTVRSCIEEYTLHGQTMLQQWLWRVASQGYAMHGQVRGTVLDVVVKGYGKKKPVFAREFIPFSESQFEWFVASLRGYLRAAVAVEWNTQTPRNVASCTKAYGNDKFRFPCEYRELCKWGKNVAMKYVDAKGNLLSDWQPTDEQQLEPWK